VSLNAATIEFLLAKGLTGADLLEVARRSEARRDPTAGERMARYRARKDTRNVTRNAPLNEVSNPPEENTTGAKAPSVKPAGKADIFVCPEGVEPAHWRDFMENRKRKHLARTQTAYDAILGDLAALADDEWPPGRLVQHAAGKGWGSINDPRTSFNGQPSSQQRRAEHGTDSLTAIALQRLGSGAPP
jgi:hypothetical protein